MLSKKTKYALKALMALAEEPPGLPILIVTIADKARIPKRFLEQILIELKGMGMVNSRKGKHGGYFLNRRPDEISIGHVVRTLDGPLAPLPCVSKSAYERCEECVDERTCGLRMIMLDVRNATAAILDQSTLADLMAREAAAKARPDAMYFI